MARRFDGGRCRASWADRSDGAARPPCRAGRKAKAAAAGVAGGDETPASARQPRRGGRRACPAPVLSSGRVARAVPGARATVGASKDADACDHGPARGGVTRDRGAGAPPIPGGASAHPRAIVLLAKRDAGEVPDHAASSLSAARWRSSSQSAALPAALAARKIARPRGLPVPRTCGSGLRSSRSNSTQPPI